MTFNGINDVVIFRGPDSLAATPLFITNTGAPLDAYLIVDGVEICRVTQNNPLTAQLEDGEPVTFNFREFANDLASLAGELSVSALKPVSSAHLTEADEPGCEDSARTDFNAGAINAKLLELIPPEIIADNVVSRRNGQVQRLSVGDIRQSAKRNPFYAFNKTTGFSQEQLKKIMSLGKRFPLTGSVGGLRFKIFLQETCKLVVSDIDGTLTPLDACVFCLNHPVVARCEAESAADVEEITGYSAQQPAKDALIIAITARHFGYKKNSERTMERAFGVPCPMFHLPRSAWQYPGPAYRTAGKVAYNLALRVAARDAFAGQVEGVAFGNTESDFAAFKLAGTEAVEIV